MQADDNNEIKTNQVCADCIGESYLKNLVQTEASKAQCSYCENKGVVISLQDLAGYVDVAFETHYSRTAIGLDFYECEREGEPAVHAIQYAAEISEEIAEDVRKILEKQYFDCEEAEMGIEGKFRFDDHYRESMPKDPQWDEDWRQFEKTIKTEARFFNRVAIEQLRKLFDDIDKMETTQERPLIVEAGPDTNHTHLYRARVFQDDDRLKKAMERPDKELSAPPSHLASAGRMNASGVSVFYGATSVEAALAEVRPPVGSQVAVARFEILRPIRLLDLTALGDVHEGGSIFDPKYTYRLGRMMFLRALSNRISRPVMPNDQEREYLPTQAIADFLATEGKVPLDGILYPSVQFKGNGLNVVLFHKAAKCKELEIPKGTEFSTSACTIYEDNPDPNYHVIAVIPSDKDASEKVNPSVKFESGDSPWFNEISNDDRQETLSVDSESMRVHIVSAAQIDTVNHEVRRISYVAGTLFI